MNYYAVQVTTGQEEKIKALFYKIYAKLSWEQHIKILLPDKDLPVKKNIAEAQFLLPGYLIVECRDMTNELYYLLKKIRGVKRILDSDIPEQEIRTMFESIVTEHNNIKDKLLKLVKKLVRAKNETAICFSRLFKEKSSFITKGTKCNKHKNSHKWRPMKN